MCSAPSRFVPMSKSTFILTVTGYQDKHISGILNAPLAKKSYTFQNLVQLLLLMDTLMDTANFPQQGVAPRAFQAAQGTFIPQETTQKPASHLAVFEINVMFRQNASWQGSLLWQEGGQEVCFRSVLELILLMDNALSYNGTTEVIRVQSQQ